VTVMTDSETLGCGDALLVSKAPNANVLTCAIFSATLPRL
jgi:hypothetical protein